LSLTEITLLPDTSPGKQADAAVDLNTTIEEMRPLLNRIAGSFIRLEMQLDPAGLWVAADQDQVESVLLTLVVSASDAMPLGGKLVVTTRRWRLTGAHPHEHGVVPPGKWAVLRVTDTGAPLDEAALSRLLGQTAPGSGALPPGCTDLAKVAALVRRASGHLLVDDRGENGTAISICLPIRELVSRHPHHTEEAAAILVVDHDAWMRTTTAHVLRRAGYGVLQADHATGALELLRGVTGSCIRIMLLDLDLPNEDAEAFTRAANRLRPDLQIVYVGRARAGWSEDLLTKPFTAQELLAAVSGRLGLPVAS